MSSKLELIGELSAELEMLSSRTGGDPLRITAQQLYNIQQSDLQKLFELCVALSTKLDDLENPR